MERKIYANFDEEGVYVYQAFKPSIVKMAVDLGTFGKGFGLERITWIKPSFAWILRRSEYASKHRMESIAKIKISHENWLEILRQSIETHWNEDVYEKEFDWQVALKNSDVIHQWDPERGLDGRRLERQAIQVGIRGNVIKKYVSDYILSVEDVTPLAKEIGRLSKLKQEISVIVPEERVYPISKELFDKLGCF